MELVRCFNFSIVVGFIGKCWRIIYLMVRVLVLVLLEMNLGFCVNYFFYLDFYVIV